LRSKKAACGLSSLWAIRAILLSLCFITVATPSSAAASPGLTVVSGNGQVTPQFFNTSSPLTVQARDASGNPIPNLPISWAVTQGQGTVPPTASTRTDSEGIATAFFRGDVLPGYSFAQQTVTASSSAGSVNFVITTVINRLPNGSTAELPLVSLLSPPPENRTLSGRSGNTIPGAIVVQVAIQSGSQSGALVSNVGIRIVDYNDPTSQPAAQCVDQPLTDSSGIVRCDLLLTGAPGTYLLSAQVGEFRFTPGFFVTIGAPAACTYMVASTSQQFQPVNSIGSLTVTAPSGCTWTASTNASWITIPPSTATGSGSGSTSFNVAANSGPPRSGTITVGGQSLSINQSGSSSSGNGQPLSIVTGLHLTSAVVGSPYNASLTAAGGKPPYNWTSTTSLPAGLTLNPSTGVVTGTPSTSGSYTLPITVSDQGGSAQTQTFSLSVVNGGQPGGQPGAAPSVTNTGFPDAAIGVAYSQILTSVGGCASPFSAPPTYTITSGGLPAGLAISKFDDRRYAITGTPTAGGPSNFGLTATDPCAQSGTSNFTINVTGTGGRGTVGAPAPLAASPSPVAFTWTTGSPGSPSDRSVLITGPSGATFSGSAIATSGGNWLTLAGSVSGNLPATLTVRAANVGALAAGNYSGSISVSSSAGSISIPVSLVISAPAAALVPSQASIDTLAQVGSAPLQQPLNIALTAGTAHFAVVVTTANGGAWLAVNSVSGDTPANLTVTFNPAGLLPAIYTGAIQIVPTAPVATPLNIPVTLKVTSAPALKLSTAYISFVSQPGQPAGTQTLTVTSTGLPVDSSVAATTASGGSWLAVSPSTASTPLTVNVTVNATGLNTGTYQGAILVNSAMPAVVPVTVPVTLIVQQSAPVLNAVVNAANFQAGALSPGEIVTVFGSNIGPSGLVGSHVNSRGALDSILGTTRIYFDDVPAPLIYSSNQQASAIVPYEVAGKATTRVQVEYLGTRSAPIAFFVVASAPAFFTFSSSGQGPAAALNEDGSVNTQHNGADPGSIVVLYATGQGVTTPDGVDGLLAASVYPRPVLPVRVTVAGQDSEVLYAGAAPQLAAGLLQINVRLPSGLPPGSATPIVLTVGDNASQAGVTIFSK
jgi:uncharacterized protein (TIGR03437 family)